MRIIIGGIPFMYSSDVEKITLIKCNDGSIWVTSDEDPNGTESIFSPKSEIPIEEQMMIALADFFEFEPANVLNFDCLLLPNIDKDVDEDE